MTDDEWLDKMDRDFAKLKHNREKVPLDVLRTRYERPYNTLVAELECDADWWAGRFLQAVSFPLSKTDAAGNERLNARVAAILEEEKQPGRLRDRWRAALTERLDREEFERLVSPMRA